MMFQFRPVLTICAALGLAVLIALGTWQLQRRAWKLDLIAQTEAQLGADPIPFAGAVARARAGEDMEYAPVEIDGVYANDLESRVFGTLDGAAGVYVFTPFRTADGGDPVYVNRGFAPQAVRDPETRAEGEVNGPVNVRGLFREARDPSGFAKLFRPVDQPAEQLFFTRDPKRMAAASGIETIPYYIDSSGAENPGQWPKGGTTQLDFYNKHLEYALTWFGLAAGLAGVYLVSSLKRRTGAGD